MLKQEEQHVKKFVQEFKEFAMRGNVIDLAVGVSAALSVKLQPL